LNPVGESPVNVVGLVGGTGFGPAALAAIEEADVLVGSARHLASLPSASTAERIRIAGPLPAILEAIAERVAAGRKVCVLASGDPGFFGIVRALNHRIGSPRLRVHPAPSSVSLAFARLGVSWDDATVVSAHGRSLDAALALATGPKVAVLTSPDNPPQAIGLGLLSLGCGPRQVAVLSRIGESDESFTDTDLAGLASGTFNPMSVVILTSPELGAGAAVLSWGLAEDAFEHRNRMITKSEVRAVALGKLSLPATGVLWDLGAGSGSVAIECARLRPGLRIFAVERDPSDAARIRANVLTHDVAVEVIEAQAPDILRALPDPDRVFVGGGGLAVLETAVSRLRPGGVAVATYALVDRAAAAWKVLGSMVQIAVSRGVPIGDEGVRLSAENPVFLCWGPSSFDQPGRAVCGQGPVGG